MIDRAGLLSSQRISRDQLFSFFESLLKPKKNNLKPAVGILAFFEPSTRTRVSFEMAGVDLGVRWIHMDSADSSLKKGESFADTFKTLTLYQPDFFVVRHSSVGFSHLVHRWTQLPVLNAGDGQRDHPTQGILDAFTLWERNKTKKYKIAFFGDVTRSRVARADIHFFRLLGYSLSLVDDGHEDTRLFAKAYQIKLISRKNLKSVDVVVALRTQRERGSERRLSPLGASDLKDSSLIMHPGPVLVGEDMAHELCDFSSARSLIHRQVENGLRVRKQILADLMNGDSKK